MRKKLFIIRSKVQTSGPNKMTQTDFSLLFPSKTTVHPEIMQEVSNWKDEDGVNWQERMVARHSELKPWMYLIIGNNSSFTWIRRCWRAEKTVEKK